MNIEYVGRHFELDDDIRDFSAEKLGKVVRFVEEPVDIRVILEKEKHRQIADIHLAHRFGVLQATEATDSIKDAIVQAVGKLEKQARRSRKKFMDRRRRADRVVQEEHRWPMEVLQPAEPGDGRAPKVIKTSHLTVETMSLEGAIGRLEEGRNDFLVYRDEASDRVRILYKRRDEHYGLLEPEL